MNFDLNISNYKNHELKEMFDLPHNFDEHIIDIKESKLRESILNNKEINKETRNKTITFLKEAKKILLGDIYQKVKNVEASFDDYYNLNYDFKSVKLNDEAETQHMIQEKKNYPYVNSSPSEFFPGVINPLGRKLNRPNLNIDTRFRENYYSSLSTNFNISLPLTMNNVVSMQLDAIELPTTFYNISKQSGNNFFTLNVSITGDIPISYVVTIPDGNYGYTQLINLLNTTMSNIANSDISLINFQYIIFGININNNTGSGQMFVSVANDPLVPVGMQFSLNFQADRNGNDDRNTPLPLKIGWNFGFRNGIYENNINYVSEGIVDLSGPKYVYLVIDDHNNNVSNNFYSAFNSSILNKNILARISLQSGAFNIFSQNSLNIITPVRRYFGPVNIVNLNIQLLDEYGRIINLNNMDYSFSLTFESIYDL